MSTQSNRLLAQLGLDDRPVLRILWLFGGLFGFGASLAMILVADLGLPPWDVFHQGLGKQFGWSIGTAVIVASGAVLLLWIPLRQRPGLGTLANAVVVGLTLDLVRKVLPESLDSLWARVAFLLIGVLINGVTTGLYIGAELGPGPRDGLMTGIAQRGPSVRVVRTGIEITVLAVGVILGGTVGIGTILFALAIGPLAQIFIPRLSLGTGLPQ